MSNSFRQLIRLTSVLQGFMLGMACLLTPNASANPIEATVLSSEQTATPQENPNLTDSIIPESPNFTSFEQNVETLETKATRSSMAQKRVPRSGSLDDHSCPVYTPIMNTSKPNVSPDESEGAENLEVPTSSCAADLMGVPSALESVETTAVPTPPAIEESIAQENTPDSAPESLPEQPPSSGEEPPSAEESDEWRFTFKPYVTIPVSTYGTATARGRTVNYSLSLGELLDSLRVTASGRFEAWKGRWGFIFDGYFVSLKNIGNLQISKTRTPNPLNALDFLLSNTLNSRLQETVDVFEREIQAAEEIEQLRASQTFQALDRQVQTFEAVVAQDAQDLQDLEGKIQEFKGAIVTDGQEIQTLELKIEDLQGLDLNTQGFEEVLSLSVQDSPKIEDLQKLNAEIQQLNQLPDLGQLEQELTQTREALEQASQEVKELREMEDSEALQELDAKIQEAKALLDRSGQALARIQEFQENREPQQLDADADIELQFDQGIYDFALSYHFGDLPLYELPDKPSNRDFPLIWFEPIVGVRLNDISIEIQATLNVELSSTLVNSQGTFQNTFTEARTWFEPMLGGKLGVQVSDPLILWVRGDVSGFGLSGDTDLSWNIFFGVDWWVARNISLQLAYRFYSIEYSNGSGQDEFEFDQQFNGPVFAATFHF